MSSQRRRSSPNSQTPFGSATHATSGVKGMHRMSALLCPATYSWRSPETVQCDRCKKYFHMRCVQPPLLGKPSRGYGWTCAPCSKQHEEEVDSHDVRHPTPTITKPKSNAPPVRGRGRPRKDRGQAEREENLPVKHFNMWPFRYFG